MCSSSHSIRLIGGDRSNTAAAVLFHADWRPCCEHSCGRGRVPPCYGAGRCPPPIVCRAVLWLMAHASPLRFVRRLCSLMATREAWTRCSSGSGWHCQMTRTRMSRIVGSKMWRCSAKCASDRREHSRKSLRNRYPDYPVYRKPFQAKTACGSFRCLLDSDHLKRLRGCQCAMTR